MAPASVSSSSYVVVSGLFKPAEIEKCAGTGGTIQS